MSWKTNCWSRDRFRYEGRGIAVWRWFLLKSPINYKNGNAESATKEQIAEHASFATALGVLIALGRFRSMPS